MLDRPDWRTGFDFTAHGRKPFVQPPQKRQRINVAVSLRKTPANYTAPKARNHFRQRLMVKHLSRHLRRVGVKTPNIAATLLKFCLAQTKLDTAGLVQVNCFASQLAQFGLKFRPKTSALPRPARVRREIYAFALHPDQAEIAPRRTKRHITFVKHQGRKALSLKAKGNCRTDKTPTNDNCVVAVQEFGSVETPAILREADICWISTGKAKTNA